MKLKQLKLLSKFVNSRLELLHANAVGARIYYWSRNQWCDSYGAEVQTELFESLEQSKQSDVGYYRPSGERNVFFWIQKLMAVMAIDFSTTIYSNAQSAVKGNVDRLIDDALNEYRATHDTHTGLLNRIAFDQLLLEKIQSFLLCVEVGAVAGISSQEADSQPYISRSVILASLDIDHFKAINDRFGHGYGDLVLAVLAERLEKAASRISEEDEGRTKIDVFRLGGEEFQILISGEAISEPEGVAIAERFRQEIRSEPLPSSTEFECFREADFFDGTPLPHDSDRRVTVSIGVSSAPAKEEVGVEVAKRLKRQADLALYSSKISGRDRVRYYGQILEEGGRIAAVDPKNGIIAVDIGRAVGVKKGQEFFVYPPKYDGETDFYIGEGRSRKRVGRFPRFRAGRIAAFDVQDDVSFCRVIDIQSGVLEIVEGSTLQAIPLGSISHLVGGGDGGSSFEDQESLRKILAGVKEGAEHWALAVAVRDIEKISEDKGIDKANECLARVGRQVLASTRVKGVLAQAGSGGFLVLIPNSEGVDRAREAANLFSDLVAQNHDLKIGVGWSEVSSLADDGELHDANGLLDAALLASIEAAETSQASKFSASLWGAALARSRRAGDYSRVLADYEAFSGFGVTSYVALTQVAYVHLYGPSPNLEMVESFLRQAADFSDPIGIAKANLGCFLVAYRDDPAGLSILKDGASIPAYSATMFYAAHRYLSGDDFVEFVRSRKMELNNALGAEQYWLSKKSILDIQVILRQYV